MTWKKLVKKAKKLGYELDNRTFIQKLYSLDQEFIFTEEGNVIVCGKYVSQYRTPDQMYQIMLALED